MMELMRRMKRGCEVGVDLEALMRCVASLL
jgi:hypothetical protein